MGAAIWSASPDGMFDFPARSFAQFFHNHGFLQWKGRPQWRVVQGGSKQYVSALASHFSDRIHTRSPVQSVRRRDGGVTLEIAGQPPLEFDEVILRRTAISRCACWPIQQSKSARSSGLSATKKTKQSYIQTLLYFPKSSEPGPVGTTTFPPRRPARPL